MKLNTLLLNEVGESGEGGGGAGVASPLEIGPSDPMEGTTPPAEPSPTAQAPDPSLVGKLFNQSGSLADGWEKVMEENGMEKAVPYFGRDGFGGKQDEIVKGLANLIPLSGKKIEEWSPEEVAALSEGQRADMLRKVQPVPDTPEGYGLRDLEVFKGQDLDDEFVDFWSQTYNAEYDPICDIVIIMNNILFILYSC